ncbi:MAG: hypothetical protein ACD_79C00289G0002 [uncultured bacterium]|nr:MAG: hypothetical protein ACD_79C00289G0002 [uncultured bacterium]
MSNTEMNIKNSSSKSLVYKNIYWYRTLLNILYFGKYYSKFKDIISLFEKDTKCVVELCFGDILIADYCRQNKIEWIGYDTNESFVKHATIKLFNAVKLDIMQISCFPEVDVCIISAALYHFYDNLEILFKKMLLCAPLIIISEPVNNICSYNRLTQYIAGKCSNAGYGDEFFRFNEKSLIENIETLKKTFNFSYEVVSIKREMLVKIYRK